MVMNGISECIVKSYPGSVVTVVPGHGITNVIRVNAEQADLSLSHSVVAAAAVSGNDPFEQELDNIASVASLYTSHLQIVVNKKLGITSFDEVVANKMKLRLSVESIGSAGELTFRRMLNEYGVTYEEFEQWGGKIVYKSREDSADMLADGLIDGFSTITLYPAPPIQRVAVNKELAMLSINPELVDSLAQKYGYGKGVVPANTYAFNDRKITTVTSNAVIIIPKNAPEKTAYKVARAVNENLDYLRSVHVALEVLTPEKLTQNLGAPLHTGAQKYYQEVGVSTE